MKSIYPIALRLLIMCICTLTISTASLGQISGTVFKDFDNDGLFDNTATSFPYEKGHPNVVVNVYNASNTLIATLTTGATGTYSFTAGAVPAGSYRVEFVTPSGLHNGNGSNASAASSNTEVQFITAPATGVNYGVASGNWYVTNNNPLVATSVNSAGDPTGGGSSGLRDNLFVLPYSLPATGTAGAFDPAQAQRELHSATGSVFGISYQKATNTLLMSAYYKRHIGFGPNGIGAIYKSQVTTGNPAAPTLLVNVSTIGINVGTDTRSTTIGDPNYLPPAGNGLSRDSASFSNVGKRGIGDIDISEDGANLYMVNLFQNTLHRINIGVPLKATASITSADVTTWTIPNPAGLGTLTWHPFALKTAYGKVYVGGVMVKEQTTNHNLATDTIGQRGVVYEFDPASGSFTEVLRFPLSYRRAHSNGEVRFPTRNNYWCAWQNNGDGSATGPLQNGYNAAAGTFNGGIYYPQPILADIEFTDDNQMLIGMRDRFGDQMGYQQPDINGFPAGGFGAPEVRFRGLNSADNLIAGKNLVGNSWTLENRGQINNYGVTQGTLDGIYPVGTPVIANTSSWNPSNGTPYGIGNGGTTSGAFGPGAGFGISTYTPAGGPAPGNNQGGYYLNNQNMSNDAANSGENGLNQAVTLNGTGAGLNAHFVKGNGGLGVVPGTNEYIFTLMDPVQTAFTSGLERMVVNTNGAATNGNMVQRIELSAFVSNDPSNMGKSNAMGDVEVLTPYEPIEVGNRIFRDANGNGIQDAGAAEAGINGVSVELVSPGLDGIFGNGDDVVVATTTTATIAGQPGSYFFNTLTTADPRAATSNLVGVPAFNILPGFNYQVRIPNASGGSQQAALAGTQLTNTDVAANTLNNIDNDAVTNGTNALVTFNTNNTNHSFDIGFKPQASIGDKVWRDDDKDGIQDAGEPGVAGITVTLYQNGPDGNPGTADDIILGTTVTDAYGMYLFDNLTPSTNGNASTMYNVGFTLPANYQFTTQTNTNNNTATNPGNTTTTSGGSTAANGSDANITTGRTGSFFLVAGEAERGVDAGIVFNTPPVTNSIGNRVWLDNDGGGDQDAGEPGVSGVTVTLYASDGVTIVATTVTDVNGNYLFTGLPANTNYIVGVTPPAGMLFTTSTGTTTGNDTDSDVNANTASATFGKTTLINTGVAGTTTLTIDAGLIVQPLARASLGDRVWYDNDRDGVQDPGEPGIAGVTVELLNASNVVIATTTTDALGNYIFPNLLPGNYRVQFGAVAGMQRTTQNSTSGAIPDATDSDADPVTGRTAGYGLVAGEKNMSVDAGYYSTQPAANVGALGDKVWNDLNGDGVQDANEPGVAGVTVILYNSAGTAIATTVTDANGNYLFPNLTPGNYSVGFTNIPTGYGFTGQDKGGNDATDSDANPATGRTALVAVTGGNTTTTLDAGIRQGNNSGLGSLGDKVWYDLDNDGIQDAGELGVAGVTVNLYNDANNDGIISGAELTPVKTTTTNALGEYIFDGLNAGNYQVGFTLPTALSAYTLSTINAGANDNVDSDGNPKNTSVAGNTAGAQTSYTALISLAQGEDNLSVDLGLVLPAATPYTLGGTVWFDTDSDGLQAGNPARVPGVLVTLYNNAGVAIATTTTDENGDYLFAGLAAGDYSVGFSNYPAGYDVTAKEVTNTAAGGSDPDRVSGRTPTVTVGAGNPNDRSLDAGLVSPRAALGNYVWDDLDRDGIQDAGETPVAGVTVSLYFDANNDGLINGAEATTPVATAITDADGKYFFPNLNPGNYQVGFTTIPTGMEFTTQDNTAGPDGDGVNSNGVGGDSDVSPSTGRTAIINLSPSEVDLTVDAGIRVTLPATIGNKVWADLDTDGIQDANEPGIGGVVVTLYNSLNQPIGSAVTDGNGNWQITNVPTGTGYYVIFTPNLPSFDISGAPGINPAWTAQNIGANGTAALDSGTESDLDSDVTPTGANAGRTGTFSIVPGNNFPNIDAGIINWPAQNVLPIQLVSFTAQPQNNTVILNWVVATETNVATYEVEYSVNNVNFIIIGNKAATGSRNYNLLHTSPKLGLNYYRLKITDKDGRVSYSEVRKVNFGSIGGSVKLYPVPAVNEINITVTGSIINQGAIISILSVDGRLMYQQQLNALSQTETLDIRKLANGKYIMRIITNTETVNKQFEVIR